MAIDNMGDFRALEPFFRVIEEGLDGLVDGGHFFDLLADDVVFEFIITVPGYPRRVEGRENLIELYRGYHEAFFLDRCFDLRVHRADDSTVTLEYASEGKVTATGRPYANRYISVVTIRNRKIVHWRDYLDPLRVFAALEDPDTSP
jgi:ketosteroid isomerase-like protein